MKKTYIAPELLEVMVSSTNMIADSIQNSGRTTSQGEVTVGDVKTNNRPGRDLWTEEW